MNVNDPTTWLHLGNHPRFSACTFDPYWYDGDADRDLERLRCVATKLTAAYGFSCELNVLDDCQMFVRVSARDVAFAEFYFECRTVDSDNAFLVDTMNDAGETPLKTEDDVVRAVCQAAKDDNGRRGSTVE